MEVKINAINRCFELGEMVQSVADEIGYSTATIYNWRKKYIHKGKVAFMRSPKEHTRKSISEGNSALLSEVDVLDLKEKMHDMQMEIDILKETINVLKKDPGVDHTDLKNREKAVIIGALKDKYSLPKLLDSLGVAKSSYYYQMKAMYAKDKYQDLRTKITELFHVNRDCYGYRRIHMLLKNQGGCGF